MKLGKLEKIDLRDFWKHEALDFTTWLAEKENLCELGDEIGLDIELIAKEYSIGRFHADILAKEETTDRKIIIENQLETTDHSHLGQILTYAAGVEAEYIIWIVKDVKDEHKQAVDWLNEYTNEKINFFLIKIELWKIGESQPAPKFVIVSKPNNWTKSIRASSHELIELSDTQVLQLEFWQQLQKFALSQKPLIKLRTPRAQHWYDVSMGRSDCYTALTINKAQNYIGCEIYIPDSKKLYNYFFSHKTQIEQELNIYDIEWQELPNKKASRIRIYKEFNILNTNKEPAFLWLIEMINKFKLAFNKKYEI